MNKKLAYVFAVVFFLTGLVGCASTQRVVREAYPVPTPYVPEPPNIPRPDIALDTIDLPASLADLTEAQRGEVIKALYISAVQWKQYAEQLQTVVDGYKKASVDTKAVRDQMQVDIDRINKQAGDLLKQIKIEDATPKKK